ncbi:MAG: hypothetical protein P1V20_09330 [Verrucomicrobiales bacterium]|nr:hypothetical protein [Verrucomicrobiales bacterium]
MPPSIDPVTNIFGTGSSLIGRILLSFGAGGLGNYLSSVIDYFSNWSDFASPLNSMVPYEFLPIVFWPWVIVDYMIEAPAYALLLLVAATLSIYKIILSDGPVLFWSVFFIFILTPGSYISDWSFPGLVPLAIIMTGLGAGLWYAVNLDHPEWVEWFREKTGM